MGMEAQTNGDPGPRLIARATWLVLGWWDESERVQKRGLNDKVYDMNVRLVVLENDKRKFFKFGYRMLWLLAFLGIIPVVHALGVPTDTFFKVLLEHL